MSNNSPSHESMAHIVEREGISAVWLVPFIALLFGGWLLIKAISERGVFITIEFDNATGIVAGKTEVKYRGLTVGKVQALEVAPDLQGVIVEVEMIAEADDYVTENAKFWYVTADVSISGVKGLDTLLSGSYINIEPDFTGSGNSQSHFIGLDEEPNMDVHVEGLHLELTSKSLGSVAKDSPVLFKQIKVGHVSGYKYDANRDLVKINVFVEPEHAYLVKENSRFWNASGFNVSGSLRSGLQIQTESIASIVSGGIAFDNSEHEPEGALAKNGQVYPLHTNYQDAQMGYSIILDLEWGADVDVGAPIVYQGITLGRVDSFININPDTQTIQALAKIDPRIKRYLTTQTQFFLEIPQFDLGGVTNLHRVLVGAQIGIRPSITGEATDRFQVLSNKPAYQYAKPGLHLILETDSVRSLHTGVGIYYKQQQVGSIQAIENNSPDHFLVHIFIEPQFKGYVSQSSRFWHASGLKVSGNIQGIEINAQSAQAILKGGIAFDKGAEGNVDEIGRPKNGDSFKLYSEQHIAQQRVPFWLTLPTAQHVKQGTRIMYRGEAIGSIHDIEHRNGQVYLSAGLLPAFEFVLKDTSQFWLVTANISLSGLTDSDALFGGAYFALNVGQGEKRNQFVAGLTPPIKSIVSEGLQLVIEANSGRSVNSGSPVVYRGITVGQVDNISLDKSGEHVDIHLTIDEKHRHLVNQQSRFFNVSGVKLQGGINGISVQTESLDALLTGGLSFYNPANQGQTDLPKEGSRYLLFDSEQHAQNAGLNISVHFKDIAGLKVGQAVKYRNQIVGNVEHLIFEENGYGVKANILLNDQSKRFAASGTKFWFAKPQVGLVANKHISDFLGGGFIGILPGRGHNQVNFVAEDMPPVMEYLPYGLNLKLTAAHVGSVRVDNPVLYRQVQVGKVIGVGLSDTSDKVNIFINIAEKYANLITANTKFWNTSGVEIEAGLFSGVEINSESIETLLSGGIAFATPESEHYLSVEQGHQFELYEKPKNDWHRWSPKIAITP